MSRLWTCWRFLPGIFCAVALSAAAQQSVPGPTFLTAAWRNAPRSGGQAWSREAMLDQLPVAALGKSASRQDIVALLGQPGLSAEYIEFGAQRAGRRETYRLSAANDKSLRINYDRQRRVESHEVSRPGCAFPSSAAHGVVPKTVVTEKLMKLGRGPGGERRLLTMAEFSALVGVPAKYWSTHDMAGDRNSLSFGKVWRLVGEQRRYLSAGGSIAVPHSSEPPSADVVKSMDAENSIGGFELTTFWPDCLPP